MNGVTAHFRHSWPGFTLDVTLDLPGRGVTALFGPSGCGKTSTLRAMAGLLQTPGGRLWVNGEAWQDGPRFVPPHRRALGYVFQDANLFAHLSVRGNVEFGQKRVPPAQRRLALDQAVDLLGIAALMDRRTTDLSGGERQRVAIARALATSPRLLLLDEPLAALDAQRKADVLPWLERLHRELDIPVIYVSHALDEVQRLADHVVLMEAGRAVQSGPLAQVLTQVLAQMPAPAGTAAGAWVAATVQAHDAARGMTTLVLQGVPVELPDTMARRPGEVVQLRLQIAASA
jgi:molybdate transport system ATP-binding protein